MDCLNHFSVHSSAALSTFTLPLGHSHHYLCDFLIVLNRNWCHWTHSPTPSPDTRRVFLRFYFYLFLERGEGREKEKERNSNVLEKHQSVASPMSPTGDLAPQPGECALIRNQTSSLSTHRPALSLLSHTSQGQFWKLGYIFRVPPHLSSGQNSSITNLDKKFKQQAFLLVDSYFIFAVVPGSAHDMNHSLRLSNSFHEAQMSPLYHLTKTKCNVTPGSVSVPTIQNSFLWMWSR